MKANWQRGVLRLMRVNNYLAEVTGADDITPWYRRVGFTASEFLSDFDSYPTMWIRLWVPSIEIEGKLVQRAYTLVDPDPHEGTFSLDFVLHHPQGAAGGWAQQITAGETVEIACTPQPMTLDTTLSTFILAGDTTALPAINSLLQQIPGSAETRVLLQDDHDDRDRLPISLTPNTDLAWMKPGPDQATIADRIHELAPDPANSYVWIAGEKTLVRGARNVIRDELGFEKDRYHTQTYWIQGKSAG